MTTARLKYAAATAAFLATSAWAGPTTLIEEGFEDFNALAGAGWVMQNESAPGGSTNYFAGNTDAFVFAAHQGTTDSFVAANFNNAAPGGLLSNWLITPLFSTAEAVTVTFWARADILAPFFDEIVFGFSDGSTNSATFSTSKATTLSGDWTQFSATLDAGLPGSTARFVIGYVGLADNANYIGIDTLKIVAGNNTVPEPSTWLLAGLGLLGMVGQRRRASTAA